MIAILRRLTLTLRLTLCSNLASQLSHTQGTVAVGPGTAASSSNELNIKDLPDDFQIDIEAMKNEIEASFSEGEINIETGAQQSESGNKTNDKQDHNTIKQGILNDLKNSDESEQILQSVSDHDSQSESDSVSHLSKNIDSESETQESSDTTTKTQNHFLIDEDETQYHHCRLFCHPSSHGWTNIDEFCDLVPARNCESVPPQVQRDLGLSRHQSESDSDHAESDSEHFLICENGLESLDESKDARKILVSMDFRKVKDTKIKIEPVTNSISKEERDSESDSEKEKQDSDEEYEKETQDLASYISDMDERSEFLEERRKKRDEEKKNMTQKMILEKIENIKKSKLKKDRQKVNELHRAHYLGAWDLSNPENPMAGDYSDFCMKNCNPTPNWPTILDPISAQKYASEYSKDHTVMMEDLNEKTMKRNEICDHEITRRWRSSFLENAALWGMPMLLMGGM